MTANAVLVWTTTGSVLVVLLTVGGLFLFWRGSKDTRTSWSTVGGAYCLLFIVFVTMATLLITKQYPGDGIIDYLNYTKADRDKMRAEASLVRHLRPMMRKHVVVCPDESIFAPENATLLREWTSYYSSFLQPAPLGRGCYYSNTPFTSGIEKIPGQKT